MNVRLITMKNGEVVLNRKARTGIPLDEILEMAEFEVADGYADYSMVEVDGEIYAEYEA